MKCGTTTLFEMLAQHPGCVPARTKEIAYLNNPRLHRRGERWYRAHFPTKKTLQHRALALGYPRRDG